MSLSSASCRNTTVPLHTHLLRWRVLMLNFQNTIRHRNKNNSQIETSSIQCFQNTIKQQNKNKPEIEPEIEPKTNLK